ncbi:MAG: zinc ribbon domain-containing protein [Acutalibacteraceae bacterium]
MAYCINCGHELIDGSKFCNNCGCQTPSGINGNSDRRRITYDGVIHKCPNCGEVLDSFVAKCPSCGYEIRDIITSSSVQELALKLEKIEAQTMPHIEEKKSVMKMVFGKDFKEDDEVEEAQERFDEQKRQQKVNIIINFCVPNTKEDILEFMILASSNIDVKKGLDDEVSKAWLSKLEQVYERAKLLMGNTPDFTQIKYIYEKKKAELKNRKFKGLAIASFIVGGYALLNGLVLLPVGGVIGVLLGIALLLLGILFISIYNKNKKEHL